MDDKLRKLGAPLVAIPSMPDQQLGQIAELLDGEIGSQTRLSALLSNDANTHICCLDHGYIVATITNATCPLLGVGANEFGNVSFLNGRAATGDDGWETDGGGNEGFAVIG